MREGERGERERGGKGRERVPSLMIHLEYTKFH